MKIGTKGFLLNIIISSIFILIFYHNVLFHPNSYLFTDWGDGIKNYYTYAYYIDKNVDTWNHEGLNYPYGESMFYTDCQPIIAFSIKSIAKIYPGITAYSIGIINFLMIITLLFTSALSYFVLRRFRLPEWLAAISAFSIMVLAPQIGRITGHLALSYSPFLPLTILLLLKYEDSKKRIWSIIQGINIFFWLSVHAYLGGIAASFLVTFYLVKYIRDFSNLNRDKKLYYNFLFQIILPMFFFTLLIKLTDTHIGRTTNPWGFFATRANFGSVFLPHDRPLNIIYNWIGSTPKMRWEGWSYIGILSSLICAHFIYSIIKLSIQRKKLTFTTNHFTDFQLQNILLAGIIVLLFSMAYPFKLGLHFLLDWFSFIKQFRASGRFAWTFYFIINYLAIVYVYNIYKTGKYKKVAICFLILIPLMNVVEGFNQHKSFSQQIISQKNLFDKNQLPEYFQKGIDQIKTEEYQAILSLPFYFIGGENFTVNGTNEAYFATELSSFHTKLPILGSHLTRNGIQEAKNICQVISPNWYKKAVISDIHTKKDILIVKSSNNLNPYEQNILSKATMIYSSEKMEYYKLAYDSLFAFNPEQKINEFISDSLGMTKFGDFYSNTNQPFLYQSYDTLASSLTHCGMGALTLKRKQNEVFLKFYGDSLTQTEQNYTVSFWVYNCGKNFGQDILNFNVIIESISPEGELKWDVLFKPSNSTIIKDCWSLVELPFTVKKGYTYHLIKSSSDKKLPDIIIDDLFIYPQNGKYYRIIEINNNNITRLFYNNHDFEK